MARKKEQPKPISALRFDFVASLENVCQQAIMMLQVVDTLVRQDTSLKPTVRDLLKERSDALRMALIGDDSEGGEG